MFNLTRSNAAPDRRARVKKAVLISSGAPTPRFRRYVHQLSAAQIEEQWRAHKSGFVAIASAPCHGLQAVQLHTIWLLSWADRFAAAAARARVILENALRECNREALMRKIHDDSDDRFYAALGPEYHHARTEAYNANFMFMHCTLAYTVLRNADEVGELTLEWLDQAVAGATVERPVMPDVAEQRASASQSRRARQTETMIQTLLTNASR
jgi:hypothetical protein